MLSPARNPNPDLKWEEKHEVNVGLDFSMWDSRLSGSFDAYRRDTKDMLYNYSVPVPPNLFGSILANVGNMRNEGLEGELTYEVFQGSDLRWTTSLNGSTNRNKLVSLSNEKYRTVRGYTLGGTGEPIQQSTHRVDVGKKIGNSTASSRGHRCQRRVDRPRLDRLRPIASATAPFARARQRIPKYYRLNNSPFPQLHFSANMRGAFVSNPNYQRMYYENPRILIQLLKVRVRPVLWHAEADGPRNVNTIWRT